MKNQHKNRQVAANVSIKRVRVYVFKHAYTHYSLVSQNKIRLLSRHRYHNSAQNPFFFHIILKHNTVLKWTHNHILSMQSTNSNTQGIASNYEKIAIYNAWLTTYWFKQTGFYERFNA